MCTIKCVHASVCVNSAFPLLLFLIRFGRTDCARDVFTAIHSRLYASVSVLFVYICTPFELLLLLFCTECVCVCANESVCELTLCLCGSFFSSSAVSINIA